MATLLLVASFTFLVVRFSRHTAARLGVLRVLIGGTGGFRARLAKCGKVFECLSSEILAFFASATRLPKRRRSRPECELECAACRRLPAT